MRKTLFALLVAIYPLLVYFGLQVFAPRMLVVLLLVLAGLRWLAWDGENDKFFFYWVAAIALVATATLLTGSETGLLFYPLLMNIIFLVFFSISLAKPPTIIEAIARKQQGDLPIQAIAYTRQVTIVWCGFFVFNGIVSVWSVFHSRDAWLLYNGLISYLFMAILMGGEYLVRLHVMKRIG